MSTEQKDFSAPYCTWCVPGDSKNVTVTHHYPQHWGPIQVAPSITKQTRYPATAEVTCNNCGRSGKCPVGKDWVAPPGTPIG